MKIAYRAAAWRLGDRAADGPKNLSNSGENGASGSRLASPWRYDCRKKGAVRPCTHISGRREAARMESMPYKIGCPVWASGAWVGKVYSPDAPRTHWLSQYSRAFNAVEGNNTFYGLPRLGTVRRWVDETPPGFHFALKFPRTVTHDRQLLAARQETEPFLEILEVLHQADRLGPAILQLPPRFSGRQLFDLERYLRWLPREFPYAVEVRHREYFRGGRVEQQFDALLTELGIDRVILDSRPLYATPALDDFEEDWQRQKPRLPVRLTVTGTRPVVRIIGRNEVELMPEWLDGWVATVAGWISQGLTPYVFTHSPNDYFAPDIARMFHELMQRHLPEVPPLPAWPAESLQAAGDSQRMLF